MKFFKKLFFASLMLACFGFVATSCGGGSNSKTISPTSTEFTSGELAKYIEVVDEPTELTFAVKDGAIPAQIISLKVKLKLVKDGIKNVDPRDIDFTSLLSVAIINLVDENGTTVQDLNVKSEELLKLKKLLTGEKGATETIIFEGEFHNSEDAPKWFESAAQFTPYLTGDIVVKSESGSDDFSSIGSEASEAEDDNYGSDDSSDDSGSDYGSAYEEGMRQARGAYEEGRRQAKDAYDEGMRQAKEAMDRGMEEAYGKAGAKALKKLSGYDKAVKDYEREVDKAWNDLDED